VVGEGYLDVGGPGASTLQVVDVDSATDLPELCKARQLFTD